jgi:hypothetical protein
MIRPANWERIRTLFQTALERPPDQRAEFLREQHDGGDIVREVAAYDERSNIMMFLKVQAAYDPLRKDPRFPVLLRRVGLD